MSKTLPYLLSLTMETFEGRSILVFATIFIFL